MDDFSKVSSHSKGCMMKIFSMDASVLALSDQIDIPICSDLALRELAEKLVDTEIAFVCPRPLSSGEAHIIEDLDQVLAAEGTASSSEPDKKINSEQSRSLLPVSDYLLSAETERRLFIHMNDLKRRANGLRSRLDLNAPSRSQVEQCTQLLVDAKRIRDHICNCNLRLVFSIARKLSFSEDQFEELVAEAFPILLRCVDLFDASRGYRFSTYVTHAVRRHLYRVLKRIQRHRRQQPTVLSPNIIKDIVGSPESALEELDSSSLFKQIWKEAAEDLDDREKLILKRRFGLDGGEPQTLRKIAEELKISKERVRQLQIRALEKLRGVTESLHLEIEACDLTPAMS
ncbi:MAG: hypothetical protein Tsb009_11970 [Planctomycetaceae bacterium]